MKLNLDFIEKLLFAADDSAGSDKQDSATEDAKKPATPDPKTQPAPTKPSVPAKGKVQKSDQEIEAEEFYESLNESGDAELKLVKQLKKLRTENAQRRLENKRLASQLESLSEKAGLADKIPEFETTIKTLSEKAGLADKIPELVTQIKTISDQLETARAEAAKEARKNLVTVTLGKHGLSPEFAELFAAFPDDQLDAKVTEYAKKLAPKGTVSVGNGGSETPSSATDLLNRYESTRR